jgi:hypothetical protein
MTSIVTPRDQRPISDRSRPNPAATPAPSPTSSNGAASAARIDRVDPRPGRLGGVELVMWPSEATRREELAGAGRPCILVIAADEPVPPTASTEDWVREPVDPEELTVRAAALRRRAECGKAPTLDDGLLVHDGAWAAIPPAQIRMVELLVERLGSVVRKEELAAAADATGASDHEQAVKAAMNRLAKRLAPLGLVLRSIRGRGYLLELADPCPVHGRGSAAEA